VLKLAYPPKKPSSSQFYVSEKNGEPTGSFPVLVTQGFCEGYLGIRYSIGRDG